MNSFKYILMALLLVTLAISSTASSTGHTVHYDYYDNETGDVINNAKSVAYDCTNTECSTTSSFSGFYPDGGSTSDGRITIEFPETKNDYDYDYALYHFADGYLPWEDNPTWHGSGYESQIDRKMVKADQCTSTVNSFSVTNDVYANEPVVVNVDSSVSGDVSSAFDDKYTGIEYVPEGTAPGDSKSIKDKYYSATTEVRLVVDGTVEKTVTEDIFMSSEQSFDFQWTPSSSGTKDVKLETEVIDSQCSTKGTDQSSSKQVDVQEERPKNEYYTLINDLSISDTDPKANDELTFEFSKISNYAHEDYSKTPVETDIEYSVTDSDGNEVYSKTDTLSANSDSSKEFYSFKWTPSSTGTYTVNVNGESVESVAGDGSNPDKSPGSSSMTVTVDPEPTWTVKFDVQNSAGSDLQNAEVSFDGNTKSTDSSGLVYFNDVKTGEYSYSVEKSGYVSQGGSVSVRSDSPSTLTESIIMDAENTPPLVSGIPDKQMAEGGSNSDINLDDYVTDETADSSIIWSYSGNSNVDVSINDGRVTFSSDIGWTGSETVTFTAKDEQDETDSDSMTITVTSSNSAPTISGISDVSLDEDDSIDRAVNLKDKISDDRDTYDELGIQVSPDSSKCGVSLREGYLIDVYPDNDFSGSCSVTVEATDSEGDKDSETFTVNVNEVNDAPFISSSASKTISAYSTYRYDMSVDDPDDSTSELTFSVEEGPAGLVANSDGSFVWDKPENDDAGPYPVELKVSDGEFSATEKYDLTVFRTEEPATPPTASVSTNTTEGGKPLTVEFDGTASSDPDGSISSYEWSFGEGGTDTGSTAVYTYEQPGTYTAQLNVTDNDGASDLETVEITVTGNNVPEFTSTPVTSAKKGQVYNYDVSARDGDGDTLHFDLEKAPKHMSIGRNSGQISWRPSSADDQNVSIELTDGKATVYQNFTINVVDETGDSGYSLEWNKSLQDQEITEVEAFNYGLDVDYNGSASDLIWNVRESDFKINGAGKSVNLTNSTDLSPGETNILVEVFDTRGSYIADSFNLTVNPALYWINEPSDQSIDEGDRYSQDLSADVGYAGNKSNLTWNVTENRALFNVDQGLVEDTEQLSTGTYEVGLNVSDDKGRKINTSYVLTVNSVNDGGGNDGGGGSSGGGSSSFSGGMSILDSEPEKNLSIGLSSDVIAVGQSVTVSGTLGNAEGSENVTVTVDGEELGEVQVSEDGGYSMSFTPEDTGNKTVEAVSGDLSASAGLEVIPGSDLEISSVSSPEVVRLNDTFSVCTDIASGSEPEVELFENGVSVENRTGTDVCFRRTISEPGDYEYLVEASVSGQTVQNSFTVDVRELSTATVDSDSADSDEAGSSAGQRITGAFNNAVSGTSGKVGISILAGLILTVAIIFGL